MFKKQTVTYDRPSNTAQVSYATVATAFGVVLAWAITEFAGVQVGAETATAFGSILGWAAGKWGT